MIQRAAFLQPKTFDEHGRAINLSPFGICFDKIKEWLTFCDSHHQKLCGKPLSVNGLTVIDCMKRRTTTLEPAEPYLTRSYVWGAHISRLGQKICPFASHSRAYNRGSNSSSPLSGYRY